jgi:hypothetical protein
MKKNITISLIMLFCTTSLVMAQDSGGSGTSGDPYLISTVADLAALANAVNGGNTENGVYFQQTDDIDCASATLNQIGDEGNTHLFMGTYDGNGHAIKNFSIHGSVNGTALFGFLQNGGTVKNLGIVNATITNSLDGTAALVGWAGTGTIQNCYVSGGTITGKYYVGGLVGENSALTISRCYTTTTTVTGDGSVGGFIGYTEGGTISDCYARCTVSLSTANGSIGGFVGGDYGAISNCYSTSSVQSGTNSGGFTGLKDAPHATNCFWDISTSGQTSSTEGAGKSTAEMKVCATFTGWSFKGLNSGTIWNIGNGRNGGYPYLDSQYSGDASGIQPLGTGYSGDPYLISTINNLYWITQNSDQWDKYYQQTADIDASSTSSWDGGAGFSPIGIYSGSPFTGSYDGQAHTITGLYINRSSTDYIGLFGYTNGATIKNVNLVNVNITGKNDVGGLIGLPISSTATNCCSNGSVTGGTYYTGGLIGYQSNYSTVSKCYSGGSVSGSGQYIGGLIGIQCGYSPISATNCYSIASVTGGSYVGGLIGCQSNGFDVPVVENCYSVGSVTGSSAGGLIGLSLGGTVTNCFWDMTSSGQASSAGGTGEITADMQTASTFFDAGWSGSIWNIGDGINSGYPYLKWQNPTGTPIPVELTSFTATTDNLNAKLSWKTATEVNNYGFNIERRMIDNQNPSISSPNRGGLGWGCIGFVQGNGTSNSPKEYSYIDASVASGTYAYRLKQIDNTGAFKYSQEAEVTVVVPKVFALSQNYPNPFNPSTTINFTLAEDSRVSLRVYDMLGREVQKLVDGEMKAGEVHNVLFDASKLSSGLYFYRLETGKNSLVKKLVFMK